jgi:acetyl-CoA synthetase
METLALLKNAYITEDQYNSLYERSINDPMGFWHEQAKQFVHWHKAWDKTMQGRFDQFNVRWYVGGQLNACYNCLDRHLEKRRDQIAILWEGDQLNDIRKISYGELYVQVCRFANVLKKYGIKKGDRVCIYLPVIPEAVVAMLACARIGAVHSIVFGGFSAESLRMRIQDADCQLVITADEGLRGGKLVPLKKNTDTALEQCPQVSHVIVVQRTGNAVAWNAKHDRWYHQEMADASDQCPIELMEATDPLFILYTSGSTGKPKGAVHSTGGYLVFVAMTFKYIFNYQPGQIYWCTADIGWITGHSYVVYGPLANGATTLMYEGTPGYPSFSRYWEMVDRHQVNIFYTAPTAIRALRREGDDWVRRTKRSSLMLLGTVGEPINPDVWEWYAKTVGDDRCPIVDTWWQTETGGILISPLPGATKLKPGSATKPFFGIVPDVVDDKGQSVAANQAGKLIIKQPWPGMMQSIIKNKEAFEKYFTAFPGTYFTGDDSRCDDDGYYWITGRDDDVIKVSGHRIGTGELESAIITHHAVSEVAVVAVPDDIKGNAIQAYITLVNTAKPSEGLKKEIKEHVRTAIGPIATPDKIQWAEELPKTRSGKIMRRILRKIACGETKELGDISTLADPGVVSKIIEESEAS